MSTDDRDPRLRAQLEVEPLDEVTRRRLVRRAVDEVTPAPPPLYHRWTRRWLPAAAAVLLVLGVGGAVVVMLRSDNSASTDASRGAAQTERAAPVPDDESVKRDRAEPRAGSGESVTVTRLGDLGDASTPERLAARTERRFGEADVSQLDEAPGQSCAGSLTPALAVATGAIGDQDVTVLVYDDRIVVVDAATCATLSQVAR